MKRAAVGRGALGRAGTHETQSAQSLSVHRAQFALHGQNPASEPVPAILGLRRARDSVCSGSFELEYFFMDLSKIKTGENPPYDVNVVIEIPLGGNPVKYELDKVSGAMYVDRFLYTAMFYPGNYGFIPHTLAADGDPMDVIVLGPTAVVPGAVVRSRPVGALIMEDEAGGDEKIIAVPVDKLHPYFTNVGSYRDLPDVLREQVAHFFAHYKDLEKGKWVKVTRWAEPEEACELIRQSIANYGKE
jgi:inorganic pyrophosphatase